MTLVDAQFGKVDVLLPYWGFEDVYQGQPGTRMIALPGGRDPRAAAGMVGYDPDLQLGYPVPRGARLSLGFPICMGHPGGIKLYRYFIVFRDRCLHDQRTPVRGERRVPYHYAVEGPGARDTSVVGGAARWPIDARVHTIWYEQSEPLYPDFSTMNGYVEGLVPQQMFVGNALHADGSLARLQQGIYDPATHFTAREAPRQEYQCDAEGDEIILFVKKLAEDGSYPAWDFDGEDLPFSNVFGRGGFTAPALHPDVRYIHGGVRICAGSNP